MSSPGSCSRCSRPLPVDSDSLLCPECLRTAGSAGSTPASAARHPHTPAAPPAPGGSAALSVGPPAVAPAGHPFAAQFQTTFTDTDRTRTPHPDRDTGGFEIGARDYLPEAPPGYDLIGPLGSGGWSTVYLAREHATQGTVAIKFLHAPTNQTAFERFLVEARALRQLDHPNIVRVFAVETHWREPFLTMEYAAGGTLADLARAGGPLPDPADAARLMIPVAEAVAAAHAAGILHRDLKPSNVLLAGKSEMRNPTSETSETPGTLSGFGFRISDFSPKVSDFGLAKRADRDDGLTRTGPLGTPSYMSPEAAAGRFREVGPAADVYGLGATLYHLLTGRPPFTGDDSNEIIRKVLTELPDRPRAVRPDIPAGLEAVVVKALEKNPAARYPTPADVAADLRRFLAGQVPAAPVLSRGRRVRRWVGRNRRRVGLAVGLVLLAVALVAGGRQLRTDGSPPPDPEQAIRDELAAGKPVRLLGADGRPKVAGWPLGGTELIATPDDGGTCSFQSQQARVLLLLTDPGIDRYRVRAEVRQDTDAGAGNPPGAGDAAGLVLGYAWQNGAKGTLFHTMLRLGFNEAKPNRKLTFAQVGIAEYPPDDSRGGNLDLRMRRDPFQVSGANLPLAGPGAGERPWRTVAAEVTPGGVRMGNQPGGPLTSSDDITEQRFTLRHRMAQGNTAFAGPLPAWSPRMPVGIWCRGTGVAVRNVTIEPLPD